MTKIGILKYPGSSGDHDLYWAVWNCCGQKAVILESGNWNPEHISALLIPGGLFVPGYSDTKDIHLISHIIRNNKPVLTLAEGFNFIRRSEGLTCDLLPVKEETTDNRDTPFKVDNSHFWFTHYESDEILSWPASYRFYSFSPDENLNSLVVSTVDKRILGVGFKQGSVASLLVHPERAVDEITGDVTGAQLFKVLRTEQ
jgi:phosphoribosylformylglycinamidine synthase subunit PurQ / glutaminase